MAVYKTLPFDFDVIFFGTIYGCQSTWVFSPFGGDKEIRTLDPLLARQVLSQLSYTPL